MSVYTYKGKHHRCGTIPLYIFHPKEGNGKPVLTMKSCVVINGQGGQKQDRLVFDRLLNNTKEFKITKLHKTDWEYDYGCLVENLENEAIPESYANCLTKNMQVYFGVIIGLNQSEDRVVVGCGQRVFTDVTFDFQCLGKSREYPCVQVKSHNSFMERGSVYPHEAKVTTMIDCKCGGLPGPVCSMASEDEEEGAKQGVKEEITQSVDSDEESDEIPDEPYDSTLQIKHGTSAPLRSSMIDLIRLSPVDRNSSAKQTIPDEPYDSTLQIKHGTSAPLRSSMIDLLRPSSVDRNSSAKQTKPEDAATNAGVTGAKPKTHNQYVPGSSRTQVKVPDLDTDGIDLLEFEAYRPTLSLAEKLIRPVTVTI